MSLENPNFLKKKYNLHDSPEVESAAERTEARNDEKVPQNPAARIQNYLDRFKEITERTDPAERERGMQALKHVLHDKFVIKSDEIPEAYFDNQRRLAREQGHGDIEIADEQQQQLAEVIISDQQTTLDNWVYYLTSPDATYPDWLKYYAFRSILGLSTFDKEQHKFGKRDKGTTAPFPDLNREALAYVLDAIEKKYEGKKPADALAGEERQQFEQYLQGENFGKLYAWAIEKVTPASADQLTITEGQWIKYDQNSNHMPLVESLQGHGTGWCTAGESTAKHQLQVGDFYVYYSLDPSKKPTIPRVAIRMEGDKIAEVRGIAQEQNLDPYIGEVVQDKLQEFGSEGQAYQKKSVDMQWLTAIDTKTKTGEQLTKDDLIFLYEIDSPIKGFGYQHDPRIEELRAARNPGVDMLVILDCAPENIAHTPDDITENTKAYVGKLAPGIFEKIQAYSIEHIYTTFPEGKLQRYTSRIGGKTAKQLEEDLAQANINIGGYARKGMLHSQRFVTQPNTELVELIRLTVADLGLPIKSTTNQIYRRAQELGLDLCPAEVGPHLRLQYINQPINDWMYIAMKQIAGAAGLFALGHDSDGLWLDDDWVRPGREWIPNDQFVFRLRKKKSEDSSSSA